MRRATWAVAALFAGFAAVYWPHVIAAGLPFAAQFSFFVAACAVLCMAHGLAGQGVPPGEVHAEEFEFR